MKICRDANVCDVDCYHKVLHVESESCNTRTHMCKPCINYQEGMDVLESAEEKDPNNIPAGEPGAKLDAGKPLAGILSDFSLALLAVIDVGTFGAKKYSRGGWQSVPNGEERYFDAEWRHLLKSRNEDLDEDSGLLHLAHQAWNTLARLELRLRREKE
jgi:hypothetical protein